MTDFHTVLCKALDRVGAVDGDQRDRVYDHLREVTVRELRNHRPPLAEVEIESRISTFDTAIDRIESELSEEREERRIAASREAAPDPTPFNVQPESFDQEPGRESEPDDDHGAGALAHWDSNTEAPQPMWGSPAIDMAWDESSAQWHDPSQFMQKETIERTLNSRSPGRDENDFVGRCGDGRADSDNSTWRRLIGGRRRRADRDSDEAYSSLPQDDSEPKRKWRSTRRLSNSLQPAIGLVRRVTPSGLFRSRQRAESELPPELGLEDEPRRRPRPNRRAFAAGRSRRRGEIEDPLAELAGRLDAGADVMPRTEPPLLGPPASEAVSGLYLPSPGAVEPTPAEDGPSRPRRNRRRRSAAKSEEASDLERSGLPRRQSRGWIIFVLIFAIAVITWSGYVFVPILFPSGPVAEGAAVPAAKAVAVGESIMLFQGQDPTIFEAGADNPVQYQGDETGGHVRISSTIASGGAKAVLGPGVANRLSGHEIRVVLEARGTPGQAAPTVRLAYQRGAAIIAWRTVRVFAEFGVIGTTWQIPQEATGGDDFLLIEPGVPGDGNAIDIRSIRIEIVD